MLNQHHAPLDMMHQEGQIIAFVLVPLRTLLKTYLVETCSLLAPLLHFASFSTSPDLTALQFYKKA